MNIVDLAILKKMVAGGGGSGTDNYNDLSNLPQINGETLAGNKTAANLGLQDALTFDSAPTEDSTNPVESGGVYNALAGKQDNLTFDDDPTENSTNPVKSGGVYSALAGKQDNLTFDGVYNASTNKAATESTVTNAIAGLDVSALSVDADETISSISETDGKIKVTKQDIAIVSNQVTAMTGYTKPSSAPATPAIQTSDTANQAFGKLEFKADTNQSNILSVEDMVCATEFSSSTAYAVGDMVTYEHKLYKFINAHQGAWSASDVQNYDLTRLEAEDRAALIECVDAGAKNKLKLDKDAIKSLNSGGSWSGYVYTPTTAPNLTVTINDDSTVTLNGSASSSLVTVALERKASSGFQGYVLSGSKANTKLVYQLAVSPYTVYATADGVGSAVIANYTDGSTIQLSLQIVANSTFSNTVITPMICTEADWKISQKYAPYALPNTDLTRMMTPFFTVPINHNMIYRGQNLGDTLTADQDTALSSGNFTDLYLGDYWTKSVTIPDFYELTTAQPSDWTTNYTSYYTKSGNTYTAVTGSSAPTWTADTYYQKSVSSQTVTLKAVIADFDTFYGGYNSSYATINTHHAAVIVTGFNNVVWNKTNTTAGGYVNSLIHKWLVGSVLPEMETWFGSAKVLSHQKLLTNAITGDAASGWAWSSQKISLLSENQMYGSKVWGNSKAANGGYEPGEAFKHLNVFNHIDTNLLFGNKNIWLRDIVSAVGAAGLSDIGDASYNGASGTWIAPAALILLS